MERITILDREFWKKWILIRAQVSGRPIGLVLGLSVTLNPFSGHPSFKEIENLSLNEKISLMRNNDFKNRIFSEKPNTDDGLMLSILRNYENIYILDNPPNYEPDIEESLGYQAKIKGLNVLRFLYETLYKMMENNYFIIQLVIIWMDH